MSEREFILEMDGISKSFPGVKALDNVKFNVRPGTVHALMGENGAGKSTLMKCLFGIFHKDAGRILMNGEEINFKSPHEALVNGISMVHQELEQVRERNVMDNVWLGRYPMHGMFVDEKKMYEDTKKIFDDLEIDTDPRSKLSKLTVSQRQMVDIAKAVSYNCKIVVMDEPTSSLVEKEVVHLFKMIRQLKKKGVGIIYISHKLSEIYEIADDVTVMRDGQWIDTSKVKDVTIDQVVEMMVGRELTNLFPPKTNKPKDVILKVENLAEDAKKSIQDISFELREGEILGIAGLLGAGRTELLETIFGTRKRKSGTITYKGREILNKGSDDAVKNGFALCTEERRYNGIFPGLSVAFNSVIINIKKCKGKLGLLSKARIKEDTEWVIDSLNVKTPKQSVMIRSLSGGNQQKVIVGKWLLMNPDIILMDDPTRGIDVGAKYEIYKIMIDLAKSGKSIIFSSSEMTELLGISDRILVLSNGRIAGIYDKAENPEMMTQENIFKSAAKYL